MLFVLKTLFINRFKRKSCSFVSLLSCVSILFRCFYIFNRTLLLLLVLLSHIFSEYSLKRNAFSPLNFISLFCYNFLRASGFGNQRFPTGKILIFFLLLYLNFLFSFSFLCFPFLIFFSFWFSLKSLLLFSLLFVFFQVFLFYFLKLSCLFLLFVFLFVYMIFSFTHSLSRFLSPAVCVKVCINVCVWINFYYISFLIDFYLMVMVAVYILLFFLFLLWCRLAIV